MASLCEQLDAMLQLPPNWDGYGAGPIEPGIVDWAKDFVAYFEALQSLQGIDRGIRVYPSRTGGVQIEWEDSRFERELELNPDGSIGLLHVEKATGAMREETFRPGKAAVAPGFLLSLGEIATVFAQAA
jgi:hypothetical protein